MTKTHNFNSPRNLYEKLLRDADKLEKDLNGDNFYNFISTAYHLKNWINHSPIGSHESVKRLLKRISKDPTLNLCSKIIDAEDFFIFEIDSENNKASVLIEDKKFDPIQVKKSILDLYENYFMVK